jgi:hypothetical protein
MATVFYLYWDESDPGDPSSSKLRRAVYSSLEDAKAQAAADVDHGRHVVCIERAKKPLGLSERVVGQRNVVEFERGEIVG